MEQEPGQERKLPRDNRQGPRRDQGHVERLCDWRHVDAGRTAEAIIDVRRLTLLRVARRILQAALRTRDRVCTFSVDGAKRDTPDVHAEI